jgi:hypothetical protein
VLVEEVGKDTDGGGSHEVGYHFMCEEEKKIGRFLEVEVIQGMCEYVVEKL